MKILIILMMCCVNQVHAMSGQALVTDLNAKYTRQDAQCANGAPAYHCSGILLRAVDYTTAFKFWDYGSAATTLGSVAFTYIRSDIGNTMLNGGRKSGFVLKDQITALAEGKALNLRCIYPFPTESLNVRADHGCGFAPKDSSLSADLANCAKLAVPATNVTEWVKNFTEHGSLPKNQCSLSTVVATQFKVSLEAHERIDPTWTAKPMEVLVQTWDESKPEKLPIEAVFYDASTPAKLVDAQKFQREYYLATSLYVPIVKLSFSAANKEIFSFDAKDQRYGQLVAEGLNARYANVSNNCNGKAAYYCNGVIVRVTGAKSGYHAWNPSPTAEGKGGVPFSYLRKDLGMTGFAWADRQGFIFKDFTTAEQLGTYPINLLCSFPTDAESWRRNGLGGCGTSIFYPDNSRPCPEENVNSLDGWIVHYRSVSINQRNRHQCGFISTMEQFAISLQARKNFQPGEESQSMWNEIILSLWPQNIPKQLPLEAFFYFQNESRATGLAGAQYIQQDYFKMTGNVLPVIRVALVASTPTAFSYDENEQGLLTSGKVVRAEQ